MCADYTSASNQTLLDIQTRDILALVEEVIQREKRPLQELARTKTLWEAFLRQELPPKVSGNLRTWSAALHYLAASLSHSKITQAVIGRYYQLSAASVSNRAKFLRQRIDLTTFPGKSAPQALKKRHRRSLEEPVQEFSGEDLLSLARPIPPTLSLEFLDEESLITVFHHIHRLLSPLYRDRTHIEILRYLQHVELNLQLAGYHTSPRLLQKVFAKLFPQLGLQPAKGRDVKKFVYVEDKYGHREPFVLVKLGEDDV